MFCQKCGTQNPDGGKFCRNCGAPLPVIGQPSAGGVTPPQPQAQQPFQPPFQAQAQPQQQAQQQAQRPQQPFQPQPQAQPARPLPTNPVHAQLFRQVSGAMFLTAAIAYTASLLCKLIASFSTGSGLTGILRSAITMLPSDSYGSDDYYAISSMLDMFDGAASGGAIAAAIIGMIPGILVAVAIWMLFLAVRENNGMPINTTGITIIKVITILQLIGTVLGLLAGEGLLAVIAFGISDAGGDSSTVPIFIVLMVIAAAFGIVSILYSLKLITTLNTMRGTMITMRPSDEISTYVAVFCFINAVGSLFSIASSGGAFGALSCIAAVVADIAFGLFLFDYKKNMHILMTGGTIPGAARQPAYQAAAPAAHAAPQAAPAAPQAAPAFQQAAPTAPQAPQATPEAGTPRPGETTVLSTGDGSYDGGTTVLSSAPVHVARLVRLKNNAVTMLDKPVIHIGKDPAVAECAITDNSAVSYAHAEILVEGGKYYIVDKNSTNHVYLQGTQIPPETKQPLENGTEILIANEPFRFELV